MFVIYAVDDEGKLDSSFRSVYDGTLGDCQVMFEMLSGYLHDLGAAGARSLTVVADGARWIWERIDRLVTRLGIDGTKVHQVIDWFHAVSTLYTIAGYDKSSSEPQRHAWVRNAKDLLHAGTLDQLPARIDALAVGRRARSIRKHRAYFIDNIRCQRHTDRQRWFLILQLGGQLAACGSTITTMIYP